MKRFQDKHKGGRENKVSWSGCKYDLNELPSTVVAIDLERFGDANLKTLQEYVSVWGKLSAPPKIGDRVKINFNSLGEGIVESYFTEHGYLGVCVKLEKIPEWKVKQQIDPLQREVALVFATELTQ